MAWYKYESHLHKFAGTGNAYDKEYKPGSVPDHLASIGARGAGMRSLQKSPASFRHRITTSTPLRRALFAGI